MIFTFAKYPTQNLFKYSYGLGAFCSRFNCKNISTHKSILNAKPSSDYNKFNLPVVVKPNLLDKLKEFSIGLGFQGSLRYNQVILKQNSARLYLCIQYQIDYDKFFEKTQSPDVMYTWCLVTFLHVWMICVALFEFGQTGLFVRKLLIQNMWKDINKREGQLKRPMNKKNKITTYEHLYEVFRAFMVGFDEGLLSDDVVLAGAVWRHILEMREITDYAVLGEMCDYIRKNISHLENIPEVDGTFKIVFFG